MGIPSVAGLEAAIRGSSKGTRIKETER